MALAGVPFRIIGDQDAEEGGGHIGILDMNDRSLQIGMKQPIKNLAAAYTPTSEDTGTLFTLSGAMTFTLPAAAARYKNVYYELVVIADVTCVVAAANAGELIMFNDVAANSFTWSTSSEKVGAACKLICNGVSWIVILMTEETQTTTVTT